MMTRKRNYKNGVTLKLRLPDGSVIKWDIGAQYGVDDEGSLRDFLAVWRPEAELISFEWWTDSNRRAM